MCGQNEVAYIVKREARWCCFGVGVIGFVVCIGVCIFCRWRRIRGEICGGGGLAVETGLFWLLFVHFDVYFF